MSNEDDDEILAEIVDSDNLPALNPWNYEPMEPSDLRTQQLEDNEQRRCTAYSSRTGERCRKWAVLGTEPGVCATHGASAPQVKRKARERVEMASNRLMGKLIEFAFDDTKPPATQLEAIKDSLNRAGLRPPAEIVLSQGDKPYEEIFEHIAGGSRAESRRERGYLPPTEEQDSAGQDQEQDRDREQERAYLPTQPDGPSQGDHLPKPGSTAETLPTQPPTQSTERQARQQNTTHITGQRALEIAAQLARQKAIESR
jgi:hypothetical protein